MNLNSKIDKVFNIVIDSFNISYNDDNIVKITKDDIISRNKSSHIVIARSIIVNQLVKYGFDVNSCSKIMNRSKAAIRHLLEICDSSITINNLYKELYKTIEDECKKLMGDTSEES